MIPRDEPNPSLYQAVLDAPDDDGPRLAYADWFAENGDPGRAEFIRVDCRIARLSPIDPERKWLRSQFDHLYRRYHDACLHGRITVGDAVRWQYLRGFPEHVVFGSITALERYQDEVFRYHVRRVSFDQVRSVARLAACPRLAGVRELGLSRCRLRDEGVGRLVTSPYLEHLTWLSLGGNDLGPAGIEALAAANLPRLRCLELGSHWRDANQVGPAGATALARAANLSELTYLGLGSCDISDEGLYALAESRRLHSLTTIDLPRNQLTPCAIAEIVERRAWPRLEALDLRDNRLGNAGAEQLARATHWAGLQLLGLGCAGVGDPGLLALTRASHLNTLHTLLLYSNAISDVGAAAIADSPNLGSLRHLNLNANLLSERAAWALGRSTRLPSLRHLALVGNAIPVELSVAVTERFARQDPGVLDAIPQPSPTVEAPPVEPPPLPVGGRAVDEAGLLQAMADDPDDEVPRMVYADWLDDNGDPEWAELIRSRVRSQVIGYSSRESQLAEAVSTRRLAPFARHVHNGYFDQGRLCVRVSLSQFLKKEFQANAAAWFEQARVQGLHFDGTTSRWGKVGDSPVLATVRQLVVSYTSLRRSGMEALCASPHLAGIHTLDLGHNPLGDGGLEPLTRAAMPRLRRLLLQSSNISLEDLAALLAWPQVSRLTTLNLATNWFQPAVGAILASSSRLAGLRRLDLSMSGVASSGGIALAGSPHFSGLTHLNLARCNVDLDGALALARSPYLRQLRVLDLGYNRFGEEGARALADSPTLAGVQQMTLPWEASETVRHDIKARHGRRVWFT